MHTTKNLNNYDSLYERNVEYNTNVHFFNFSHLKFFNELESKASTIGLFHVCCKWIDFYY